MTDLGSTSGTVGRLNIAGSADTSTNTLLQFNKGAFGTSEFTQFYTSGSNYGLGLNSLLYVNKGSGNVGIGETSPGSKLSVSGGGSCGAGYDTTAVPMKGLNGHSCSQLAGTPLRPPRYGSRSPTRSVVWGPCPPVGPLAQAFQSTTSQLFASLLSAGASVVAGPNRHRGGIGASDPTNIHHRCSTPVACTNGNRHHCLQSPPPSLRLPQTWTARSSRRP